jgi:ABC-2 type transport system permease protein
MITRIARKEFTEMARDGRFRWAGAMVLGLLLTALAMGWKHYREVNAQREAAQRSTREQWLNQGEKNPHSAAHYGIYAFKPKLPLSFIDQGLDSYLGVTVYLEAHVQNQLQFRPAEDATALHRFGTLTAAATLQLLLPLLIVSLSFSAFAGERESGALRQLLSIGVARRDLACGKALGGSAALALLLVPATAIGVFVLALSSENGAMAASAPRMALMSVGYLLYFGAFIGLSLFVSALAPSSRLALVALLVFWIFNSLVAPRIAADVAERLFPTPTYTQFTEAIEKDKQSGIDGHNPANQRTAELKRRMLEQYGVEKVEDLPVNFDGIALQAGEEYGNQIYDKHYQQLWRIYEKHERAHMLAGLFAPLLPARALSMAAAGVDFAQHRDFSIAAERYRRMLNKTMNDDLTHNSKTGEFFYFADRKLWESMPDFTYQTPSAGWALRRQIGSLAILLLWFLGAMTAAMLATKRMKVD